MKFTSKSKEKSYVIKKERVLSLSSSAPFLASSLCLPIVFILYVIYSPGFMSSATTKNFNRRTAIVQSYDGNFTHRTTIVQSYNDTEDCDLFKGHWVWDNRGSMYTNYSCTTIPFLRNCFLNGRRDTDFLHWRWKPQKCELPRFDPKIFLRTVQGKTMAFIGDSLGRNQMESLLCLLSLEKKSLTNNYNTLWLDLYDWLMSHDSFINNLLEMRTNARATEETPTQLYKDEKDRFVTWQFHRHNFTLMASWSQFLVAATERIINGSSYGGFDLQLDKVDESWSRKLPLIDYAIFSDAHWFFRQNYLYEDGKLVGCVYCQATNVTDLGPGYAIRRAFRAAFDYINGCKNCNSGILTLLRTYSPAHFENGAWNSGGGCNRTRPFSEDEVNVVGGSDLDHRNIQLEEIERARKIGERRGNRFEILDITKAMQMRPDGHPGVHWGNKWMKGYSDCIHWCLPGPADIWNEILLWMLRKQIMDPKSSPN